MSAKKLSVAPLCWYALKGGPKKGPGMRLAVSSMVFWLLAQGYLKLNINSSNQILTLDLWRTDKQASTPEEDPAFTPGYLANVLLKELGIQKEGVLCLPAGCPPEVDFQKLISSARRVLRCQGLDDIKPKFWETLLIWLPGVAALLACAVLFSPIWVLPALFLAWTLLYWVVVRNLPTCKQLRVARAEFLAEASDLQDRYETGLMTAEEYLPYDAVTAWFESAALKPVSLCSNQWHRKPSWFMGKWPTDPVEATKFINYIFNWLSGK